MKTKLFLALMATAAFLTLPALAQHGGSSGGHGGDGGHGGSHSDSSHGQSATADDHGHGGHGGHGNLSAKLARDPQLAAKLQALLPTGTDLNAAAQGFKNLRDFAAAVNAAHDLNIPFDQLKAKLTGPGHENLRKAIADLQPTANASAAAKQAEKEAKADIKSTDHDDKDGDHHGVHDATADKDDTKKPG